jgi:hypothetical protein
MRSGILLCLALAIFPWVIVAQEVSVNYNHNQSLAKYHTYARGSHNTSEIQDSILARVVHQDINNALQERKV